MAETKRFCTECGAPLTARAKVCKACGASAVKAEPTEEVAVKAAEAVEEEKAPKKRTKKAADAVEIKTEDGEPINEAVPEEEKKPRKRTKKANAKEEITEQPTEEFASKEFTEAVEEIKASKTAPEVEPEPQPEGDGLLERPEKGIKTDVSDPAPARKSRYAPVSTFGFVIMYILLLIPIVNIVLLFVWARKGSKKVNRRNFARATLIMLLAILLFVLVSYLFGGAIYGGLVTKYAGFLEGIGLESLVALWGR